MAASVQTFPVNRISIQHWVRRDTAVASRETWRCAPGRGAKPGRSRSAPDAVPTKPRLAFATSSARSHPVPLLGNRTRRCDRGHHAEASVLLHFPTQCWHGSYLPIPAAGMGWRSLPRYRQPSTWYFLPEGVT
jgi:hypothetical protein